MRALKEVEGRTMLAWAKKARLLLGAMALAGCGELTSGGLGEVSVHGRANDPDEPPSAAASTPPLPSAGAPEPPTRAAPAGEAHGSAGVTAAEGTLVSEARVSLRSEATGEWTDLTGGSASRVTLDLAGLTEQRMAGGFVAEGTYTRVRLVFHRVEANVTGGISISGLPLLGMVRVELDTAGTLTVERDVQLSVVAGQPRVLLVDFHADAWLGTAVLGVVSGAAFSQAVGVSVR